MKEFASCVTAVMGFLLAGESALGDTRAEEVWVARYDGPDTPSGSATAVAVDGTGNTYVLGAARIRTSIRATRMFVTVKYDIEGRELWRARYDESLWNIPVALAADDIGQVYVAGSSAVDESERALVVKYDGEGNELWARHPDLRDFGGSQAVALAVDEERNAYVTSSAWSGGESDYLTAKYDTDGNEIWIAKFDSRRSGGDYPSALEVDHAGNVYVTGSAPGRGGGRDYLTVKYDAGGNELWARWYDGAPNDEASAMAVDREGNVYVTGQSGRTCDRDCLGGGDLGQRSGDLHADVADRALPSGWTASSGDESRRRPVGLHRGHVATRSAGGQRGGGSGSAQLPVRASGRLR